MKVILALVEKRNPVFHVASSDFNNINQLLLRIVKET
jgi:hypothetical protein